MADEYVYKISSRYLHTWLRYDMKHVKNRHFHVISGLDRDFPNCIFLPILMLQKLFRVIFRVLCENLP